MTVQLGTGSGATSPDPAINATHWDHFVDWCDTHHRDIDDPDAIAEFDTEMSWWPDREDYGDE